ncbi:P-loop containing nucleoside triphosphate hydrolase protein [Cyathus striatus]|nr:P-loop containing nucleoside triphosphate hydrolase protein [Cyathus striatus]
MYIKTLTIQVSNLIEPFSSRHNVVVGRNGSGKSNFFAAIRFVLSDAYTSMSREERQALLHEGVSVTTTLSAYVEIVFDNSDNRFPTGHEEVILRRTIGLKKDEYSLDRKSASKAIKSNPYYIVPQGRITALTNAKDHERLALLKEVAGTKVYEQRRAESLRIMSETDAKRTKISELLDYIESRLSELEEEKEELKEFQDKDKERRCLEYALYQRELQEVGEALIEIEEDHRADVHGANVRREKFNEREKEIQDLERAISETKHTVQTVTLSRQDAQAELTDFIRAHKELECIVEDLKAAGASTSGKREALETELANVERDVTEKEAALNEIIPEWQEQRALEATEKRKLDETSAALSSLFAKQGRASKFRSTEINSMKAYKTSQTAALEAMRVELETSNKSQLEIDEQITSVQSKIEEGRSRVREVAQEIATLKEQNSELTERRKDLWREDTKLDSLVSRAADELKSYERALASMMDKDTGQGLRLYKLDGVYGPLYRLFEVVDPKFNIAFIPRVVDTDETASKVLDVMLKEKTGRVTFMPLNRLKPKNPPAPNAQDAEPLIDKLRFDPMFEKAFQQVFGKTCVCRDLTIAAAYVKSHGINTITLDGDKVDRKGALTGGYHDIRRSRIDGIKNVTTWRLKYEGESKRLKEVKASVVKLEQEITQLMGRITVLNGQQNQIRDSRERLIDQGAMLTREKEKTRERNVKLEADLDELETDLSGVDAKIEGFTKELSTPCWERRLKSARRKCWSWVKEKTRSGLEGRKNSVEIELNERLRRRRQELQSKLESLGEPDTGDGSSPDNLESRSRELKSLQTSIQNLTKSVQRIEKDAEDHNNKLQELRASLERVQSSQAEDSRNISRQQKTTERYLAKRQMLITRKDECNRSIRDLGVLPEEAFEKYINEKMERLVKKLHSVNEGLKKFAHVNKKAFEQYSNFTKQRDQLLKRREDLDKSAESIEELVQVLDQRKDEAIERTFKQVASNFEEVFEKLVPAGRGRLIIQRRIDQDEEMDEEAEDTQQSSVDNYTGVSIKVSFNSKVDEGLRIQQLSGGQKSLVALATVFAIQKCDPAPFYLFDEIDANLDAQYRTAVASMIQSLSSTAQFITTTFRPEMLVTADKFYGVLFNNQKVSSIRAIKREEAMEFVDQEAQAQ